LLVPPRMYVAGILVCGANFIGKIGDILLFPGR